MNFKNRIIALASVAVVAGGLGVVTVTAHAGNGSVPQVTVKAKAAKTDASKQVASAATMSSQKLVAAKQAATKKAAASSQAAKATSASQQQASSVKQQAASSAAKSTTSATQSSSASQQTTARTASQTTRTAATPVRTAAVAQTPAQKAAAKANSIRNATGETYVGTIAGAGHSTDVVQGSMNRTSAPAQAGLAMTWGGATRLSTTDGLTTEIAGHAKSNTFAWIMSLGVGSRVSVTDANGNSRSYTVYATDDVNDDSYSVKTGKDQWNAITSAGQGEAVVLQTCISSSVNRIVWAH